MKIKKVFLLLFSLVILFALSDCVSLKDVFNGEKSKSPKYSESKKHRKKAKRERRLGKRQSRKKAKIMKGYFDWPYSGPVTSPFGYRSGRAHEGIDIRAKKGSKVRASASGKVVFVGTLGGYGRLVVVKHGNGFFTAYAHNSKLKVREGKRVKKGQVLAYSGNTGRSTGPHVHFEIREGKTPRDPLLYLPSRKLARRR